MASRFSEKRGWVRLKERPRGPGGRGLCRWCGQEVPKGRLTFCGPGCVDQHRIRTSPAYLRDRVFERDRGICALCGLDTMALREAIRYVRDLLSRIGHLGIFYEFLEALEKKSGIRVRWQWFGCESLWQADHILPVAEDGGACGLENIRTLCLGCHKTETALLRNRLKWKRRAR